MSDSIFDRPARCVVCSHRYTPEKLPTFPCPDCNLSVCNFCAGMGVCCRIKTEMKAELAAMSANSGARNYTIKL